MAANGFIISDLNAITVFVEGKSYVFASDHPNYTKVKEELKNNKYEEIPTLFNIAKKVEEFVQTGSDGKVRLSNGLVYYKDKVLNNSMTTRILNMMRADLPFDSMLKFLENLMMNPSRHAINELYDFLVHRNLPITEDGHFLAYKRVEPDYMDCHTKKVRNQIGDAPEMDRNEVDDDWRLECSSGYHVGAMEYVSTFENKQGSHVMIVKVNPKDVVAVAKDCNFTKCRVCKYLVVDEMKEELKAPVYQSTGTTPAQPCSTFGQLPKPFGWNDYADDEDDEDDDWEDELDDDDGDDDDDDEDDYDDEY